MKVAVTTPLNGETRIDVFLSVADVRTISIGEPIEGGGIRINYNGPQMFFFSEEEETPLQWLERVHAEDQKKGQS